MQIENHKEEVPFAHYEEQFKKLNAEEAAARTGVKWDGKEFYVNLLGRYPRRGWHNPGGKWQIPGPVSLHKILFHPI